MAQIASADGTRIGYERQGSGPVVIFVDGATQHRLVDEASGRMAQMLADRFTVVRYDRRGRGESGDTKPYAVPREIEDIAALIDALGGAAHLYGMSSGGVLALEAANAMPGKVTSVFCYEPPVDFEQTPEMRWAGVREQEGFGARGDGAGAIVAFMSGIGMPVEAVEGFRQSPEFPAFAAVGHTIAYDFRILAEASENRLVGRWPDVTMPVMIACGDSSFPFMAAGSDAVVAALPNAERLVVPGYGHDAPPEVLAPLLRQFFSR